MTFPNGMRVPNAPSCLCGCGESLNQLRLFKAGHDARANGRLNRLHRGTENPGDEEVLAPELLNFYRGHPDFRVVQYWCSWGILQLADRKGR